METWRLIDSALADGATNMATDETLQLSCRDGQSPPVLRFYGWAPPTLSLGFFQKAEKEVDLEEVNRQNIHLVRRPTGGRAVLHHQELTYSLIVPEDHPLMPRTVTDSYRVISSGLLEGFRLLGIPAQLSGETTIRARDFRSSACFEAPSSYELVVGGKKIVGSAQVRKDGILLQHGSIMLDLDTAMLIRLLRIRDSRTAGRMQQMLHEKATSIREVTGNVPGYQELTDAFTRGFSKALRVNFQPAELTEQELETVNLLRRDKYAHPSWTFRR